MQGFAEQFDKIAFLSHERERGGVVNFYRHWWCVLGLRKSDLLLCMPTIRGGYHCTFRAVLFEVSDDVVDLPFAHSIPFSEYRDDIGHFFAAAFMAR